jgi:uncharacterized protein YeaO (DUF488 family)
LINTKRIYETVSKNDGYRILVDRIWPRGVSKEEAHVDLWMKEAGPSDELRKEFAHDPKKWEEFKKEYEAELENKPDLIAELKQLEKEKRLITLVYSAKDMEHNQAVALSLFLHKAWPTSE